MCSQRTAPVHRIIPFSSVDGPGNRCAIFFQGCGFHCQYCHNPETIRLCENCGACVSVCPAGALELIDGKVCWNQKICCDCEQCVRTCPDYSSPRVMDMTVKDVMEQIIPLVPFLSGITVSGGECTRQHVFLEELFQEVHKYGITAYVDTNGQLPFLKMPGLMEQMDMAMLDVKSFDDKEHRMLTGVSCDVVLENMEYLAKLGKLYEIRTVIVPGLLDEERTVSMVSKFLAHYPDIRYKLIAYRSYGVRPQLEVTPPGAAFMEALQKKAMAWGAHQVVIT